MKKITLLIIFILVIAKTFLVYGKTSENTFVFTAVGDFGGNRHTSRVLEFISRSDSQFHLAVGDMSYNEIKPESLWCKYVSSHLRKDLPFEILSGNHEESGHHGLIDNFAQGFPDRLGAVGNYGKEYYFDYPKKDPLARFILISPDLNFKVGGKFTYEKGNEHYQWLFQAIDGARTAGIRWVIVGMHKNCLSAGYKPCEIGEDVFNLLVEKKVDLILQGHDHNYQRTKSLGLGQGCSEIKPNTYVPACVSDEGRQGNFQKGAGPIVMILGTGGESIYPVNASDLEAPYFAKIIGDSANPTYGFGRFTVSAEKITAEFVPVRIGFFGAEFKDKFCIIDSHFDAERK